ncbi:hypothetical protein D3C84_829170 [compost metagenome]
MNGLDMVIDALQQFWGCVFALNQLAKKQGGIQIQLAHQRGLQRLQRLSICSVSLCTLNFLVQLFQRPNQVEHLLIHIHHRLDKSFAQTQRRRHETHALLKFSAKPISLTVDDIARINVQ